MEAPFRGGLAVGAAIWPDEARVAACLMVDDLTDGWIDRDGSGEPVGANDWGAGLDKPGSSFRHLLEGLLQDFPEVRTTLFVPVAREPDIAPARYPCHFRPIDQRPEFVRFLREVDADPRFELVYHGRTHGMPGPTVADYVPEFSLHASVAEALTDIEAGKRIWRNVLGTDPVGGKFPAYDSGAVGEQAVDESGFGWWCRRWDRDLSAADDPLALSPRLFGNTPVVDVPSTVHGGWLTQPSLRRLPLRTIPGALRYRRILRRSLERQLDGLLACRGVVSVQQHITSSRPDGDPQTPNLRDDAPTLRRIFDRLRAERVWHAPCGEIARYWEARQAASFRAVARDAFLLDWTDRRERGTPLSLVLSGPTIPDRFRLVGEKDEHEACVTRRFGRNTAVLGALPLRGGRYRIDISG